LRQRQADDLLVRETLHITDGDDRIAMVETRTIDTAGTDRAPAQLLRYQLGNHLGSASLELDATGEIISYEEYTPYGSTSYQAVRGDVSPGSKRYRYTGMERDEETGLNYHTARYYAPWLGRWIATDPAGIEYDISLYVYASNRPCVLIDRNGRSPFDLLKRGADEFSSGMGLTAQALMKIADAAAESASKASAANSTEMTLEEAVSLIGEPPSQLIPIHTGPDYQTELKRYEETRASAESKLRRIEADIRKPDPDAKPPRAFVYDATNTDLNGNLRRNAWLWADEPHEHAVPVSDWDDAVEKLQALARTEGPLEVILFGDHGAYNSAGIMQRMGESGLVNREEYYPITPLVTQDATLVNLGCECGTNPEHMNQVAQVTSSTLISSTRNVVWGPTSFGTAGSWVTVAAPGESPKYTPEELGLGYWKVD
ncbi:MAG: RHS repeat-associated core domain-containing protein, partial [Planctomycetaceae bacterium]